MDDGEGKHFAQTKGLTVHTTEDLLAEMVAANALGRKRGELIFKRVYGKDATAFAAAVADANARGA